MNNLDVSVALWLAGVAVLLVFLVVFLFSKSPEPVEDEIISLKDIYVAIRNLKMEMEPMTKEFQELVDRVSATVSLEKSAVDAFVALKAQVKTLSDQIAVLAANTADPAAITSLTDQLKASADILSGAIVENTPVAVLVSPPA